MKVLKPNPNTIETARFDHQSTILLPTYIQQDKSLISIFGGKWTTSPSIARKIATII